MAHDTKEITIAIELGGISTYLKKLRTTRGTSAGSVADAAGIGRTTLHRWENSATKPRLPELEAVLNVLNVTDAERARAYFLIDAPRPGLKSDATTLFGMPLPHRGDLIRALRVRRGWTQSVAAANLGVRQPTFAHWEAMQTIPSAEAVARLSVILNAYPEEREALQSSQLLPTSWQANPDIDAIAAQVTAYEHSVHAYDSPLADLHALTLKRQLLQLVRETTTIAKSDEANRLLSITNTTHSWYLQSQQRHSQAKQSAWDALHLALESRRPEPHWAEAINVASLYVTRKRQDKRAHINLLLQWLPWFSQGTSRMRMECDIAMYASFIPGNRDEALFHLAVARATWQSSQQTEESDADYFRLANSRVLARVGYPREAMKDFPVIRTLTAENAPGLALWVEVLLMAEEKNEASRLISDIETILEQFPLPTVRAIINMFGQQL